MTDCQVCGKDFFPFTARRIYCSSACAQKAWREKRRINTYIECRGCGKTVEERPKGRLYCSRECRWTHRNSLRPTTKDEVRGCPRCGTKFQPKQKRGVGKKYCSKPCLQKTLKERMKDRQERGVRCCVVCKKEMSGRKDKKYCSKVCSSKAERKRIKADPERDKLYKEKMKDLSKNRDRTEYNARPEVKERKKKWTIKSRRKIRKDPGKLKEWNSKRSFYQKNRKHRLRGAEGSFTQKEWDDLVASVNGVCPRCKQPTEVFTADHIVSIKNGGTNYISNIQPLCGPCNASKRTKTVNYLVTQ